MKDKIFTIFGHGNTVNYRTKDKRSRARSAHQLTPYFIRQGETVQIKLDGEHLGNVDAAIGLPELHTRHYYKLTQGINTFRADGDGVLSFINTNDYGQVKVEILSFPHKLPYFNSKTTTEAEWQNALANDNASPLVILTSELADVVVTPQSARNNINNIKELMQDFDRFLQVQDDTTGTVKKGKADYKTDPNRNLHIESSRSYMFAANEYTGYMGTAAMQRLLRTDNRWGIWHENGHQRQQSPWQWNAGNGMTETTVNIFSLMSQEDMYGTVTALDAYYPSAKEFIAKTDKDFDTQDHSVKLVMFWQLRQAFGKGFFPQLMQRYRLMETTPDVNVANEQKNLLIRTVSEVVNINMSPFFEKWGIYSDDVTLKHLEYFPVLEKPIWENIGNDFHTLEMPEKEYIPELIYLKKSITDMSLGHHTATFTIDKGWYTPYRYVIKKNGTWLAEVDNGKSYYCLSTMKDNGHEINHIFSQNNTLQENDNLEIEVYINGKGHSIYKTSIRIEALKNKIMGMFTDHTLTELHDSVNQSQLDSLWEESDALNVDGETISNLIKAQKLLLEKTVSTTQFLQSTYSISFVSTDFKNYTYQACINNNIIAEIINGKAKAPSTLHGLTWNVPVSSTITDTINIRVNLHGYLFTLVTDSSAESRLREKINAFYLDKASGQLKDNVTQSMIDNLTQEINRSLLSTDAQHRLLNELYSIQQILVVNIIASVSTSGNRMVVSFRNADYRQYRFVVCYSGGYISELSNGSAFYSSVNHNNGTWTTTISAQQQASMRIELRRPEKTYIVYNHSATMDGIVYDSEGMF